MQTTVSRWGNSLGIRIPRGLADDAGLTDGTPVDLRFEDGRIILEPVATPSLEELLSRITPENCHGEQLQDEPIGREVW
jgi:antitoxin MazE